MKAKLIGIGAAGNKAAMTAIEQGVFDRSDVLLINTTRKDMKEEYDDINVIIGAGMGGCGKERGRAKSITIDSLKSEKLKIDSLPDPDDDAVVIVSSSEGGTGCGSSTILAKYIREVLNINVHLVVFTGFEDDARGLQNTVEYFQELQDNYTVEAISNKKFLSTSKNKQEAERKANNEFCKRMRTWLGLDLVDSDQNIDETDLYKIATTPGFMTIETKEFDGIKKQADFDRLFEEMIYDTKSLDFTPTAKRIGVFMYASERSQNIGFDNAKIREELGEPFEFFTHIQTVPAGQERVCIMASGIKLPTEEVEKIYNEYKTRTSNVDKKKDGFFDQIGGMKLEEDDDMFNLSNSGLKNITLKVKENFFDSVKDDVLVINVDGKKGNKSSKIDDFKERY
jgi:cell division GTPase FtsZ|nr:MAG TPA: hypothetical protein [Caudoviricetes sp.]